MSIADLSRRRIYGILDLGYVQPANVGRAAAAMIEGGIDVVQLRAKARPIDEVAALAAEVHAIAKPHGVPLVINDHPQVAREISAEGVHVGQDDLSVAEARELAGGDCFVGKSTHSLEQASQAATEGADYIGFGPLFATPTKPDYAAIGLRDIREVHQRVQLPIFCIGGIKLHNLGQVVAAGAERVVIVSELLQAADIAQYVRAVRELLNQRAAV